MRICVFCGSSAGKRDVFVNAARELGTALARRGIELVYGGGRVGLMGAVADSAMAAGGNVTGVMPRALVDRELQHVALTTLHIVESMHERKARMADLADGFIALAGGAGTLEEIFEQWTWGQLGFHRKPCAVLNTDGYFDALREMIDRMTVEGFLRPEHAAMLAFETEPEAALDALSRYVAPSAKWQTRADNVVRIVAALIQDEASRVLLVRKKGTRAFMQPGGKLHDSESHQAALERELSEELSCRVQPGSLASLGTFRADAANENDCIVEAALYRAELAGDVRAAAEIEEILWYDLEQGSQVELAPLTREVVLPLARKAAGCGRS